VCNCPRAFTSKTRNAFIRSLMHIFTFKKLNGADAALPLEEFFLHREETGGVKFTSQVRKDLHRFLLACGIKEKLVSAYLKTPSTEKDKKQSLWFGRSHGAKISYISTYTKQMHAAAAKAQEGPWFKTYDQGEKPVGAFLLHILILRTLFPNEKLFLPSDIVESEPQPVDSAAALTATGRDVCHHAAVAEGAGVSNRRQCKKRSNSQNTRPKRSRK